MQVRYNNCCEINYKHDRMQQVFSWTILQQNTSSMLACYKNSFEEKNTTSMLACYKHYFGQFFNKILEA
jgi:hypothetical protein